MLRFSRLFPVVLLILAVFALGCVPAFAVDAVPAHAAATPSIADSLVAFLSQVVNPIFGALVMGLLSILVTYLNQKYKLGIQTDQNSFLFKLAAQGVALAEEKAARLAGSASALTGNQKLDIAVAHILSFCPKISQTQAQDIVHSVLAQIPGAGATGEAVTLLPGDGGYSMPPISGDEVGLVPAAPAPVVG